MGEMVERIAKTIYLHMFPEHTAVDWETEEERLKGCYLENAQAVLREMRQPTERMLQASEQEWDGRMSFRSSGAWQAMINAELRGTSGDRNITIFDESGSGEAEHG